MPQLFLNNFQTQFIADVRAAPQTGAPATELDYGVLRVSDGAAGLLRNPEPGSWYVLTAYKRSGSLESDYEILHVTGVDNSVIGECRLTVLRGQEGTAPRAYMAGDLLELRLTAGGMGVKVDREDGKGLSANDFTNAEKAKLEGIAAQATRNATDAQLRDRTTHTGAQAISTITGLQAALDARAPKENPTFTGTVSGISKAMVGLPNVDNTADVDKPVSTAQQAALANKVDKVAGKGLSTEDFTSAEKAKLEGVAAQATKNATDAQLRDRSTHTGTQAISTVAGLQGALDGRLKLRTFANAEPTGGAPGDTWVNTSDSRAWIEYAWFDDGSGGKWQRLGPAADGAGLSSNTAVLTSANNGATLPVGQITRVNTAAGPVELLAPAASAVDLRFGVRDHSKSFGINKLTINPQGTDWLMGMNVGLDADFNLPGELSFRCVQIGRWEME